MTKNPDDRYSNFGEVVEALSPWAREDHRVGEYVIEGPRRRRGLRLAVAAACAVGLLVLAGYLVSRWH